MITIIYAHPWNKSFNHALLQATTEKLNQENRQYRIIDLYEDDFNPALTAKDLALYSKGGTTDPLVADYAHALNKTDELIFIFPIWWGGLPAIVKGFFDKVLLKDGAFSYSPSGEMIAGLNISRAIVATTSQGPTETYHAYFEQYLIPYILNPIGVHNVKWINCPQTSHGPAKNRDLFMLQLLTIV